VASASSAKEDSRHLLDRPQPQGPGVGGGTGLTNAEGSAARLTRMSGRTLAVAVSEAMMRTLHYLVTSRNVSLITAVVVKEVGEADQVDDVHT